MRRLGYILFLLSIAVVQAQAQRVYVQASVDTVTVGERFVLTLTTEANTDQDVIFPHVVQGLTTFGDVELLAMLPAAASNEPRIRQQQYEVAAFAVDSAHIAPMPVGFVVGQDTTVVMSAATLIPVRSLVPDDAEAIKGLAPIAEFPRQIWPWMGAILLALALLVGGWWYWRQRPQPEPEPIPEPVIVISPIEEARQRLEALKSTDWQNPEAIKPYYVALSETLRAYLERRLDVPALERTTRELIRDLRQHLAQPNPGLPLQTPQDVRTILSLADLAKFADFRPEIAQNQTTLNETGALVEQVEASLQQAARRPVEQPEGAPETPSTDA